MSTDSIILPTKHCTHIHIIMIISITDGECLDLIVFPITNIFLDVYALTPHQTVRTGDGLLRELADSSSQKQMQICQKDHDIDVKLLK